MKSLKTFLICSLFLTVFVMSDSRAFAQSIDEETGLPDYNRWDVIAIEIENDISAGELSSSRLDVSRDRLSKWRALFSKVKNSNAKKIQRINDQISALDLQKLGDQSNSAEVLKRKDALEQALTAAMLPVVLANEAFLRSNGLIAELDDIIRSRQTNQILELGPSPLSLGNWSSLIKEELSIVKILASEVSAGFANTEIRPKIWDKLPATLILSIIGIVIIYSSARWMRRITGTVLTYFSANIAMARIVEFFLSLIKIILPILGFYLFGNAVKNSFILGVLGNQLVGSIVCMAITIYVARWLGERLFNSDIRLEQSISYLPESQFRFAIFTSTILGFLYALDMMAQTLGSYAYFSENSTSVISFVIVSIGSYYLFRLLTAVSTHLKHSRSSDTTLENSSIALISLVLRLGVAVTLVSPILALVGYSYAGGVILFSTLLTFGVGGFVLILQRFLRDIFSVLIRNSDEVSGLIPTLLGLGAAIGAIPFLAIIWGARPSDLWELWGVISNGFQMGESRITPSDFIAFIVIFVIGYVITRAIQNMLKEQVLPKTKLDAGGQNAVVDGVGYLGIFLAAVIAISTAGIDLSSLAIVAGALSVGIGFGMQTIVSNFVSGIILLVERPISQGDWIEVNGTMGVVKDISVRATVIQTFDRKDVIVPNSDLISGSVTNWTKGNLTGRIILSVGVAYGTDTQRVTRILEEVALEHPLVSDKNPPSVYFLNFGADALEFEIRIVLQDVNFSLSVKSEINHRIAERFAEEGIEIPFAQRDLWLRNPETLLNNHSSSKSSKANTLEKPQKKSKRKSDLPDADGGE